MNRIKFVMVSFIVDCFECGEFLVERYYISKANESVFITCPTCGNQNTVQLNLEVFPR